MKKINKEKWAAVKMESVMLSYKSKAYHAENLRFRDGSLPYITRAGKNNGIYGLAEKEDNMIINPSGVISFGAETAEFFYQPFSFITGNKMYYVSNKNINKYTGLFAVSCIKTGIKDCFSYANGAIPERVMRKEIMLPVNCDGSPDYDYMEKYAKKKYRKMQEKYKAYAKKCIIELGECIELPALSQKEWVPFILEDLFSVASGKRLTNAEKTNGARPFIGATDNNNGVTGFVGNSNASLDHNVLGVNYNGDPCIAFFHPYECIFTDDVKRLHLLNHDDNEYILLFFAEVIMQQRNKYGYGYKCNAGRMLRQKLLVPVTDTGEPDYAYMEQYAKNMMLKKYRQYLSFLEKSNENKKDQLKNKTD